MNINGFYILTIFFGGFMLRLFRLGIVLAFLGILTAGEGFAQTAVYLAGRIAPGEVRVLVKDSDSLYIINRELTVAGTLIIEPGTKLYFFPNGRLIDSVGGRIIADGFANATYKERPDGINPIQPGSRFYSYADPAYFLFESATDRTIDVPTVRDLTVHKEKYNYVFNVIIDTLNRKIIDIVSPDDPMLPKLPTNPNKFVIPLPNDKNKFIVPFEIALMYVSSRMVGMQYKDDINLNLRAWRRVNDRNVNIVNEQIRFIGQLENNFSQEWGHIIVLPGARAAFFRNVKFEGFRKDTTVDRLNRYKAASLPGLTADQVQTLNNKFRNLTNGAGGALTTFSVRTWLINCEFENNFARLRGGALQILQAPDGFPKDARLSNDAIGYYMIDKNPALRERDDQYSLINRKILKIDNLDENFAEPWLSSLPVKQAAMYDFYRQTYDDARTAVFLGRVRNLKFSGNKVQLANTIKKIIGGVEVVMDDTEASYPYGYGDVAAGGAIYISGKPGEEGKETQIEIGLGVNNSIKTDMGVVTFPYKDYFEAIGNQAINFQSTRSSKGARGGAIYLGEYTSLILAGKFKFNETRIPHMEDVMTGSTAGYYSMGGAVFTENTLGRLQIVGGPWRDSYTKQYTNGTTLSEQGIENSTEFFRNKSAAGGALFVDGNADVRPSPVIGGSDALIKARDFGFNIKFTENEAISWGGALFVKRNFYIHGAGGVESNQLIGYGGKYPVKFDNNVAGYAGGAIDVRIPNAYTIVTDAQRAVEIVRAAFRENKVGYGIDEMNKNQIRGGGAIYALSADLSVVKGVEFLKNMVMNGNGGAVAMIQPMTSTKRFFITDLDKIARNANGIANGFVSYNYPFVYDTINSKIAPDANMLTRFLDNEVMAEEEVMNNANYGNGTGTTQIGKGTDVTSSNLLGVSFIDEYMGFAVGQFGTIIKFSKGGRTWQYKNADAQITLNRVKFATNNQGVIVGKQGVVMRTNNTGDTWQTIIPPNSNNPDLHDFVWVGTQDGYAVGEQGTILKTIDGGQSWFALNTNVMHSLHGVFFTTNNTGFVVGDRGLILKTDDAGATWNVLISNTLNHLFGIYFTDANTGYIVGQNGTILKTTNGGQTWFAQVSGTPFNLRSLVFSNLTQGVIVGDFGIMLRTVDAGTTWNKIDPGTTYSLKNVTFPTNDSGYVVGDFGNILYTKDGGENWSRLYPDDMSVIDVVRRHPEIGLPENGVGLAGAMFILDSIMPNRAGRVDSINFNRVRIQKNKAYTGAAIYSDNYDLKLILNRSYITGNVATSDIGLDQNVITGPVWRNDQGIISKNKVSSDLAGAILYGEIQGPLPSYIGSEAANSFFDNEARFLIRLPDAPNTKGVLAGTTGLGYGGIDTLRSNYWGHTEANIFAEMQNIKWIYFINDKGELDSVKNVNAKLETFYVDMNRKDLDRYYKNVNIDSTYLGYIFNSTGVLTQGPHESASRFNYTPIPLFNDPNNQEMSGDGSIPEKLLMSAYVYDLYDKGTDIRIADYTKRRMSPIEDFAVGIPPLLQKFVNVNGDITYVKRWSRNPFIADSINDKDDFVYPIINDLQEEFQPDKNGNFYHPIGYPLYLEAYANYTGEAEKTNFDPRALNETVFFVINETTGDFIRANLKQLTNDSKKGVNTNYNMRETFRARVDLVPDSSDSPTLRQKTMRRTLEGLMNFGTGAWLLSNLWQNPYNEDNSTLMGRKYYAPSTRLANYTNLFSNRPSLPPSQQTGNVNYVTYFAGERYSALPANVGDTIRIISRTVLWREGVVKAFDEGLKLYVTNSTEPPIWTGNIVQLMTDTLFQQNPSEFPWEYRQGTWRHDTITNFLNKIFVTEDRPYPVSKGTYSNLPLFHGRGRDSILTVTAEDTMRYFDPRSFVHPDLYANLTYKWGVDGASGLARWLMVDTVYANDKEYKNYNNPYFNSKGYLMFRGRPINPFVVPGGEEVWVTAENFPPSFRTVDMLKYIGMDADNIEKFIQLFPKYLNAPTYDIAENTLRARFLQQDTIWNSSNYKTQDYRFRIYVTDSVPRYLPYTSSEEVLTKRIDRYGNTIPYVTYKPSEHKCGLTDDGKLKANLAGDPATGKFKLRFQSDFNSDDEMEDHSPAAAGWDFRYGKTAYGFENKQIRDKGNGDQKDSQDTTVFDTVVVVNEYGQTNHIVVKSRPNWMKDEYLTIYDDDETLDPLALDFTTYGKLNYRIPGDEALRMLLPNNRTNGALNTDTLFTFIITDGHGGVQPVSFDIFINVAPEIITNSLPPAKEDRRYNPMLVDEENGINLSNLLDSNKMIKVYDPNFGQTHTFELIYEDYPLDQVPRDPCYNEAGFWDLTGKKTTPKWLKINKESGLLYGTPGIKDAPRTEQVTVLVTDSDGLTVVKSLTLQVDSTNHLPQILDLPKVVCVDKNKPYEATIIVHDKDLRRGRVPGDPTETLTIEVIEPSGFTVEPSTISGIRDKDSVAVKIKTNSFAGTPGPDGRVTIRIRVTDASGSIDIKTYKVKYGDPTTYIRSVKVENSLGAYQYMVFGLASPLTASTGDGSDNQEIGKLDQNHCEYELPPLPYLDVFDARWFIPKTDGILRCIHPDNINSEFKAKIQAGGVNGNTSPSYPITITIFPYPPPERGVIEDPVEGKWYIRDLGTNGNKFNFNMETGQGTSLPSIKSVVSGDTVKIIVSGTDIEGFSIYYDFANAVDDNAIVGANEIVSVSPNPAFNFAKITFNVGTTKPIKLDIIDALGNVVANLGNKVFPIGQNEIQWNCSNSNGIELSSGSYRVRMTTGLSAVTYPFVIVK